MKTVKSAFAILISLVLLATQTAFMTTGTGACPTVQNASAQNCCAAHCQKHCCVSKSDVPNAPSVPVAQTISQIDLQMLPASQLTLEQSAADISLPVWRGSSLPWVAAVPLYQRNCSYLV